MQQKLTAHVLSILALAVTPPGVFAQSNGLIANPSTHSIPVAQNTAYMGTILLDVDATDLDHRVFQVRQQIPVKPGPLTLFFPRWLPGTHGPTGSIDRLAGLKVRTANQAVLPWQRDTTAPFAFHVTVPSGVSKLDLEFQHLSPIDGRGTRVVMTRDMLNLQWNSMLLYPARHYSNRITVAARVKLPSGWQQASALQVQATSAASLGARAGRTWRNLQAPPTKARWARGALVKTGAITSAVPTTTTSPR
ncbi:MAG: hypothetical protein H7293_09065 [Candidatus Saccharibacteria bacterium]|nr:hypothetical protein [Rhodoferax sp.]